MGEVEIIDDGDGFGLIGDPAAIEQFLVSNGLPSRPLGLGRLSRHTAKGSAALHAAGEASANAGKWVKLSDKSAALLRTGETMKGSSPNVSRAILTKNGKASHILEFSKTGAKNIASNPAILTGAAGIMAQVAMQQAIDEITDYLALIDAKVDDVLRAQKDAVFADMFGIELTIDEALAILQSTGRVSEVTWSKVQGAGNTINRTQAYALRQIDAAAGKLEAAKGVGALAKDVRKIERDAQDWLSVLARCVQLHDATGVLELDRVLDGLPEDLEAHRRGLLTARAKRLSAIAAASESLGAKLTSVSTAANSAVLLHPGSAKAVLAAADYTAQALDEFHSALGIGGPQDEIVARRWVEAAVEARDRAVDTGVRGAGVLRRVGTSGLDSAASAAGRTRAALTQRSPRRRQNGDDHSAKEGDTL